MPQTINHYTDFHNAEKYAKDYDAVVSIGHISVEKFINPGTKFLHLDFDDINAKDIHDDPNSINYGPTLGHILELRQFIATLTDDDKLLVHCAAGYSRSPAAILIAICERNKLTFHQAKSIINQMHIPEQSECEPNDIMIGQYLLSK